MTSPLNKAGSIDAAVLALHLDRNVDEPLHLQLGAQLRQMILSGRVGRGTRLPASRALAVELEISRATVVLAYDQLLSEGYIVGRRGAGMFVSPELPDDVLQVSPQQPHRTAARPDGRYSRPYRPFQLGGTDPDLFPFADWARLLHRSWRKPRAALTGTADPLGWPPLREAIAGHLAEWRGVLCDSAQIAVTSRMSDSVELIASSAFAPRSTVYVEEPGYPIVRRSLERLGHDVRSVAVDANGFDPHSTIAHANIGGALVTPSRQFPLGFTMPLARRLELLDWAHRHDAYAVEDDFDGEYRYQGSPLPALMSLDRHARSIYIGTFSKVLAPALRLGFVVFPNSLIEKATQVIQQRGAPASLVAQPALAEFIASGAYATLIRRTRRIYARRLAVLMEARDGLTGLLDLEPTVAGMHVIAKFGDRIEKEVSDTEIAAVARNVDLHLAPLSSYYFANMKQRGFVLGFAGYKEDQLRRATLKLGQSMQNFVR